MKKSNSKKTDSTTTTVVAHALAGRDGVIYTRTSTVQPNHPGLAAQELVCRQYLARKGLDPAAFVVLRDEGVSGNVLGSMLTDLLQMVMGGKIKTIVVSEVSRVTRSAAAVDFVREVKCHGGQVLVAGDTTAVDGKKWRAVIRNLYLQHVRASAVTADRVRRGQIARAM